MGKLSPAMRIVCHMMFEFDALCQAMADFTDVELVEAHDEQEVLDHLPGAQALITFSHHYTLTVARLVNATPGLRWLHFVTAGVDPLWRTPPAPHLTVSSAGAVWSGTVAEHAMALLLALVRRLPRAEQNRGSATWGRDALVDELQTLAGRRVLLLGFGDIGQAIARRLAGFEIELTALARSARTEHDVAVHSLDRLSELLPRADNLIVALPLSPQTHHLLNADMLSLLPDGATLVNVARGALIDDAALLNWLRAGRGQAALDAFSTEPLPADHALWTAPGLLITPHIAGFGDARLATRIAAACRDNLADLLADVPLRDAIDVSPFTARA